MKKGNNIYDIMFSLKEFVFNKIVLEKVLKVRDYGKEIKEMKNKIKY